MTRVSKTDVLICHKIGYTINRRVDEIYKNTIENTMGKESWPKMFTVYFIYSCHKLLKLSFRKYM